MTADPFTPHGPTPKPAGPAKFKAACRINGRWAGLAHVVVAVYDSKFHPWFGRLDLACNFDEGAGLMNAEVVLDFDDGRRALARPVTLYEDADPPEFGGQGVSHVCFDFVGLGSISDPPPRPAPPAAGG